MKPLEVHCRNRVMFVKMSIEDKGMGMRDYHLYGKNGKSFYVFRRSQGVWELAYGVMPDDVREACIDALILRYDHDSPELFYKDGKRNVVRLSAMKGDLWNIYVNTCFVGRIQYFEVSDSFDYYLEADSPLTHDHIKKYMAMIQRKEIRRIKYR